MRAPDEELGRLRDVLDGARQIHRESLRGRQDAVLQTVTRIDVLGALEDFIRALETHKLPVPPPLQREMKILQNLTRYTSGRRQRT